jgi:hypothetical protein
MACLVGKAVTVTDLQRDAAADRPGREDQVRVADGVVGMEMRDEGDAQVRRLQGRDALVARGGARAPHDTGTEVDEVGGVVHDDRGGGARAIGIRVGSPGPQHDDPRPRDGRRPRRLGGRSRHPRESAESAEGRPPYLHVVLMPRP